LIFTVLTYKIHKVREVKSLLNPMKSRDNKYRIIFQTAKVGLWEEDYTEVKSFIESLKERGVTNFRAYFDENEDKVIQLTRSIKILDVNNEVLRIHRAKSKSELLGSLDKITLPEAIPVFKEALISIAEGKDTFESEVPGLTLDGEKIYTITRFIIPREFKEFKNIIVSTIDITERKRLEEELEKSRERYRNIFENALVSIWEEDYSGIFERVEKLKRSGVKNYEKYLDENPDFIEQSIQSIRFIDVNNESVRIFKASSKEELLEKAHLTFSEDSKPHIKNLLLHILEGKKKFENISYAKDLEDNKLTIKLSIPLPKNIEEAKHVIVSIIDLTDFVKMEERLLTAQKLESLGLLAGGLAHDFNNILTAILGNLSLLKINLNERIGLQNELLFKESLDLLEETEKSILRAKGLTQQLLTFAKGGAPVKKVTDMKKLIRDVSDFSVSGSKTALKLNMDEDLLNAEVDENQLSQVLTNLIINAQEATGESGRIEIEAHNKKEGKDKTPYIEIIVRDNGPGIPPKIREKIFDPYFTTKQKGQGLGLAVAYSIVKRHEGKIYVKSEPGEGTEFVILLKATRKRAEKPKSETTTILEGETKTLASKCKSTRTRRKGFGLKRVTVLVMDDNPSVRNVLCKLLETIGYKTAQASHGEEAIKLYLDKMARGNPFDVVIMDLTIPGKMGGKETVQKLLSIDPGAKAIVSSGYSDDPVFSNYESYGFKGILRKPYTIEEIRDAIERIMVET